MALMLPPYSKKHIILFGSIALLACFILLFMLKYSKLSQVATNNSTVLTVTAKSLKEDPDLKNPLKDAQSGLSDVTWSSKGFVILDIRPEVEFNNLHLTGSINAPLDFLSAASFNPDVNMVVYGDNESNLSKASNILIDKGIRDIYLLHEPLSQLESQGYKVERTEGQ